MRVRNWKLENQFAGNHAIAWDGKDSEDQNVQPGIYICQIKTDHFKGSLKMIVIR
jgi:flagellar hook assembly protein FlgD